MILNQRKWSRTVRFDGSNGGFSFSVLDGEQQKSRRELKGSVKAKLRNYCSWGGWQSSFTLPA